MEGGSAVRIRLSFKIKTKQMKKTILGVVVTMLNGNNLPFTALHFWGARDDRWYHTRIVDTVKNFDWISEVAYITVIYRKDEQSMA